MMIYATERSAYVISVNTQSFIIIALNYVRAAYVASGLLFHPPTMHVYRTNKKKEIILDMCTSIESQLDTLIASHRISHRITHKVKCVRRTSICVHAFEQFAWIFIIVE